jgi:hypothetical protein
VTVARGAAPVMRQLRVDTMELIWLFFLCACITVGPHGLDWQGNRAWTDGPYQSWWHAQGPYQTRSLSRFPIPQLVGSLVQGDVWMYV